MKRLVALCAFVAACGGTAGSGDSFVLTDSAIAGPDVINGAGATTFQITNQGEFNHTMVVTDRDGNVVAATDVFAPGSSVALDVDLSIGQYMVSCRLVTQTPDGTIIDHYELGMYKSVIVED